MKSKFVVLFFTLVGLMWLTIGITNPARRGLSFGLAVVFIIIGIALRTKNRDSKA